MDFGQPLQVATNDVSYYCAWQPQVLWLMLPTRLGLECLCTINGFLMAIFSPQVSFSLIMAWVIICKYWTSCLSFTLFAIVLTSQAWSYCGIMFKLSYAMKPENTVMLVFLAHISATQVPFKSDHKALHGSAQAKTTHWHEKRIFKFEAFHFSLFYYRKGNDRVVRIPHRACLYNRFSPQIGHER